MSRELRILVAEDSPAELELLGRELRQAGLACSLQRVGNEEDFLRALRESPPSLVLSDYSIPGFGSLRALELLRAEQPDVPFIWPCRSHWGRPGCGGDNVARGRRFCVQRAAGETGASPFSARCAGCSGGASGGWPRKFWATVNRAFESGAVLTGRCTGIAVEDLTGRILETNRALQQMLGYSAEELQRITRRDFSQAQDQQEDTQHFQRLLTGELGHYQKERRFVRRDGRIIWGRLTISMIRDPAGRPQFPIALIEDITERQRAEEALVQYAAIVESSNDAIISTTFDGIIFSWNPAAERLYGFSAAEANGRSLAIIIPAGQEPEWQETLERIRRGERVDNIETLRVRKNGARIDVSLTTSPIKDATGKTSGASSIARDITERKRAEAALRESEENYRRLVELAPNGILITSGGKFVYLNSAAGKLFGAATPQQLVGTPGHGTRPSPLPGRSAGPHQATGRGAGGAHAGRRSGLRLDGSELDVEVTAIPFVFRGQPAIQVVVRDSTGRKLAEEALRKSEARLAEAQQIAHLGSWDQDLRFGVLAWSDETCRIFGIEPGRFEGTYGEAFERFVHPDDVGFAPRRQSRRSPEGRPALQNRSSHRP